MVKHREEVGGVGGGVKGEEGFDGVGKGVAEERTETGEFGLNRGSNGLYGAEREGVGEVVAFIQASKKKVKGREWGKSTMGE